MKCYLSAVRHLHIAEGQGDPGINKMVRLEQVLRGIKSVQARAPPQGRIMRQPITLILLCKMKESWQRGGADCYVVGGSHPLLLWLSSDLGRSQSQVLS